MNSICLVGRLTADPQRKKSETGLTRCEFTLAVNRPYAHGKETDFIPCTSFGKLSEIMLTYLKKGQQIGITGALRVNRYKAKDGTSRTYTNVTVQTFDFCGSSSEKNAKKLTPDQIAKEDFTDPDFTAMDDYDTDDVPF